MPRYYAGIGSRKTPQDIMVLEAQIATKLDSLGFILHNCGTATALRLAFQRNIPVYNLEYKSHYEMFKEALQKEEGKLPVAL